MIPVEWGVRPLGEVGNVLMCKRVLKHQTRDHGEVPFYKIGTFGGVADAFIPQALFDEFRRKYSFPRKGDVLISAAGTIGRTVIYDGDPAYFQDSNIVWIDNDESTVTNAFLWHAYQVTKWSVSHGGTVARLYNDNLRSDIYIPVPLVAEQRAIATALSDVDALLAKLDQLIAKKRDLKQAATQQLLTGQTRLPGFSGAWSTISIAKNASLKARIGWQALTTEEYLASGTYYLVTGTDFVGGRVSWGGCHFVDKWRYSQDRNIQLQNGDVLVTKDGTIGKVGFVQGLPGPATLNSGIFVIRPLQESFFPAFFFCVLRSQIFDDFISKITAGSTITHLYQKDFVGFEFLAPGLAEQTAIATVLSDMDAELAALEVRRDKTRALKQGMMQALLTGRIRLVGAN
ncbi:restriction endonuclease subunit S [Acidovorax sp. Root267]|uniref:restriction endonuclease subunit S n=1 Tax=Acidovorax sp. Root267 TaxID=1736505 RepID=UPI0018FE37D4|nr:restriction endonuclease subunit S [Acidovorax sp. Root267]